VIQLPDIRQRDGWSCGPVCAATVLQHYGKPIPRSWPTSAIDGTDPLSLVPLFRRVGLYVLSGEMSIEDLRQQVKLLRPVVCLTRYDGTGHYVIVHGVERGWVHVQCPVDGPRKVKCQEFLDSWWDVGRDCRYTQFGVSVWR